MNVLRYIPAIDALQRHSSFQSLLSETKLPETLLTKWLKLIVNELRKQIRAENPPVNLTDEDEVYAYLFERLQKKINNFLHKNELERVINATGVVIHTNLGRSRLSERVIKQITDIAESYSTLEYDIKTGKRGSRHSIVEQYLKQITGAEAALVVNNNAAAVYLVLKALAEEKEVIVSRGELVEIGGSFRISEIMRLSNAHLIEVGTTNKTKLTDYKNAITDETGMILKVHKSNFDIIGFTEEVSTDALVQLAKSKRIPLYEDLGSGTLYDFTKHGIGQEPTVQEQVKKEIDIISFSGDKLLGGPQAGIIVGKKEYIEKLKSHQLARVLRVDKFTLAALEATLKMHLANYVNEIPTVRDILLTEAEIYERANSFLEKVNETLSDFTFSIEKAVSKVGGGTMPSVELPTYVVEVSHKQLSSIALANRLRNHVIPVIVRVKEEKVQLDFRTVTDEELPIVVEAFTTVGEK